ncbi:MAG TPA: xanthine dehydrogenase family protein molybdopterin-binding subunit [Kofleriaceae bacterium]
MNRRAFLVGAASGALVVGCAFGPTGGRVWRHYRRTGTFQPNAWLRILGDGSIIFTLDRVEMGQGTMTSHAALVCEELEVDPKALVIEHAEASRSYANPDREIRVQITGGSTSTRSSWQPLREAGAVAREMLRRAAAGVWHVPLAECTARDGMIHHAGSKRSARYGDLVREASLQDVPKVRLKEPAEFKLIGKSLDRLDARPKVDGTGVYGIDVSLPGMLTAVIVRSPVRGGTVAKLDARGARARRGVVDVVTIPEGVAVVAQGYWQARTAADELRVTWDEGHGGTIDSTTLDRSFAKLAAGKGRKTARSDGDALRATKGSAIEATYRLPYLAHATMEPQNATAWIHDGRCEVWAPTQTAGIAQFRVAEAIGFDLDDVAIHTTMIGGGFGRRGLVDYAVEAARVAQLVKKPVKVIWSREDDQENDWYRPMALSRMRGSVSGATITGWFHHLVSQSIIASEGGDFVGAIVPEATPRALRRIAANGPPRMFARGTLVDETSVEGAKELPYAIPNLRVEYTPVETGVPVGFWRSVGHSHNAFVTECFFDELAHAAGQDPYELRRSLLAKHPRHRAVLELAATRAGWGTPLPAGVGRGIALHESFHSFCAQVIEASVDGNRVRVHRVVVAIDCGRVVNPGLVAAQAESAVVFGLSAALKQQVTFKKGRVQETNFNSYRSLRMFECPAIETHLVPSTEPPSGVGEPGVPPVAPALCNAIFAATGKRIRALPIEGSL